MAREIERKFLVQGDGWRGGQARRITQGYLPTEGSAAVRVRRDGDKAFLTIKSAGAGLERSEFEYVIPVDDAEALFHGFCAKPLIVKTRRTVEFQGHTWEIDAFEGVNEGLVVAEIELDSPEERFTSPPWLGEEVTGDARYSNHNLARLPYQDWKKRPAQGSTN